MAGVIVNKRYLTTTTEANAVVNNWIALVFGTTNMGTKDPTLLLDYTDFLSKFGGPVEDEKITTHNYMKFLLNNGVPVLFRRIIQDKDIKYATIPVIDDSTKLFTLTATDNYSGYAGTKISLKITKENLKAKIDIFYDKENNANPVETFYTDEASATNKVYEVVYSFISEASKYATSISKYVKFTLNNKTVETWNNTSLFNTDYTLKLPANDEENATDVTSYDYAISVLSNPDSDIYNDVKLNNAILYYPQTRFCSVGGIVSDKDDAYSEQNTILTNLGLFVSKCSKTFRALIDYPYNMTDINVVRAFAKTTKADKDNFAFFGWWGADEDNNWVPGSAGFLTALVAADYNVYNRRIAGTGFNPAFTKIYKESYIDVLNDWQSETDYQVNPIVTIDSQNNIAVMGSSTLAAPLSSLNARNPRQALDIVCVSDYAAAILNKIALDNLEIALDRLALSSMSNLMSTELNRFVTSNAITRFDLSFDTTQIGKLIIQCVLYFAIGLEEVDITISSTYDTTLLG